MKDHDEIRELLALAAAGALDEIEQCRVSEHLPACAACRAESEEWARLVSGIGNLAPPVAPPFLAERTVRLVERRLELSAERRWNNAALAGLVAFTWLVSFATWPPLHFAFGTGLAAWVALSTSLGLVTAGSAAVLLGSGERVTRRSHESFTE